MAIGFMCVPQGFAQAGEGSSLAPAANLSTQEGTKTIDEVKAEIEGLLQGHTDGNYQDPTSYSPSDAAVVDPVLADFAALLDNLAPLAAHRSPLTERQLEPLRRQIDEIDHEMLSLLARRMEMSRQIAFVKRDLNLPVYQSDRWSDVVADRLQQATGLGLDADFTRALLEKIHAESMRVQLNVGE